MKKDTVVPLRQPEGQDLLSTMLREGAQRLIAEALQAEFDEYLAQFAERRDDEGRLAVVRNGWQPRREVLTGLGPVGVKVPLPCRPLNSYLPAISYRRSAALSRCKRGSLSGNHIPRPRQEL